MWGFYQGRRAPRLALAVIFRAFGAAFIYSAPLALPSFRLRSPRLWLLVLLAKFCTFPYNDRPLLPFPLICRRTPANWQNLPGVVCPCNVGRSQDEQCLSG